MMEISDIDLAGRLFDDATASDRTSELVQAALRAAHDETFDRAERAETMMELAMQLQSRPKTPAHLQAAIRLYDEALVICPEDNPLLAIRLTTRRATALQALPNGGNVLLEEARDAYQRAIPLLDRLGGPEEVAEAEMNLGLVLQSLAAAGRARITDAVAAYQRSLRVFDAKRYPVEFVLLQNNLATAFLSIPLTDERARIREALAVQCFEEALKIVNIIDHPVEYAMLQNNLGNALQYASSSHIVENNLRALAAYAEALRVRTRHRVPLEYANTIANKANCLCNLPDDPERPDAGNGGNLAQAMALYEEAYEIFLNQGEQEKAQAVAKAMAQLDAELDSPRGEQRVETS
jgi:tetratricopeptide (TPR) repeat protein